MRIIAKRTLRDFWEQAEHRDAEQPLKAWYAEAKDATWRTPADVKAHYRHASIVGDNRVVFNIAGNKYRLVVKFHYNTGIGYVRFVGTHEAYDKIDVTTHPPAGLDANLKSKCAWMANSTGHSAIL